MLYSIKTYDSGFLLDFYTKEKILVPESFVKHWLPQLRGVEFVPEPHLTPRAVDGAWPPNHKDEPFCECSVCMGFTTKPAAPVS